MSRIPHDRFPAVTCLLKRCVLAGVAIFMGEFLLGATVAHAQTVGEVATLPEAQQLEIIMQFVNNALVRLLIARNNIVLKQLEEKKAKLDNVWQEQYDNCICLLS